MTVAAASARLGPRIGGAEVQVLDAGRATPDIAVNGPSHAVWME